MPAFFPESSYSALPGVALLQLLATAFMCGIIWFVQAAHYPLFRNIGLVEFTGYHRNYLERVKFIVIPAMLIEMVCAMALPIMAPSLWSNSTYQICLGLLAIIWISTFLLQAPLHDVLRREFEPYEHRLLVQTNWIRTIGWSLRGILLTWLFLDWMTPE